MGSTLMIVCFLMPDGVRLRYRLTNIPRVGDHISLLGLFYKVKYVLWEINNQQGNDEVMITLKK